MRAAGADMDGDRWSPEDAWWFHQGTHRDLADRLGARPTVGGVRFRVWAPAAGEVEVVGDFNDWQPGAHPMRREADGSVWTAWVAAARPGQRYRYRLRRPDGRWVEKIDPMGVHFTAPLPDAAVVWDLSYRWHDAGWMAERGGTGERPLAIYEVHLPSWWRLGDRTAPGYRRLAAPLVAYVRRQGFTHVEFLPVMEHPFAGSWGYLSTGYFAPCARQGRPQDLMALIDALHQAGIGVILDWVPAHFPGDAWGLAEFDGTPLYEYGDPRLGRHPDWNSLVFDYGRPEVRSFLLSSALFWLDRYHADGIRVDAVASMLYRDYSRAPGQWLPNAQGGRENWEAVEFLRQLTTAVRERFPAVAVIAEESTAWPGVTHPAAAGGLGFHYKWDMGWMHDTLTYVRRDPIYRAYHQDALCFRMHYAYSERFVLPLSHDEVTQGKRSLWAQMPGDDWQRAANLRLLFGYQYGLPGGKLLFMGSDLGQPDEWWHDGQVAWSCWRDPVRRGLARWVADLNRLYRTEPALYGGEVDPAGFAWVDCQDRWQSVISFLRKPTGRHGGTMLVVCNWTPVPRFDYAIGVPQAGRWRERLNSDALAYGGSGLGNGGAAETRPGWCHGYPQHLRLTLPPLAILFLAAPAQEEEQPASEGGASSEP